MRLHPPPVRSSVFTSWAWRRVPCFPCPLLPDKPNRLAPGPKNPKTNAQKHVQPHRATTHTPAVELGRGSKSFSPRDDSRSSPAFCGAGPRARTPDSFGFSRVPGVIQCHCQRGAVGCQRVLWGCHGVLWGVGCSGRHRALDARGARFQGRQSPISRTQMEGRWGTSKLLRPLGSSFGNRSQVHFG